MLVMILSSGLQLLPLLASALEFGSAAAPALTALLKMGSWLSTEEFSVKVKLLQLFCGLWSLFFFHSQFIYFTVPVWLGLFSFCILQVLPTIVKLFASNDRAIRVALLQHIDQYGESFSAQVVDEQVCC